MKTRTTYEAFDGEVFDTADACRAHEAKHVEGRLVGLTADQVAAALSREDADLADAIEAVAGRISRARREAGDLRRRPKAAGEVEKSTGELAEQRPFNNLLARSLGAEAFRNGQAGMVPDDLKGDKQASDDWLDGWGDASKASAAAKEAAKAA